jgi:hypothetical protein
MSNQPYYIWVKDSNGMSWHGLKPVTRERGEKLVTKYGLKCLANQYWLELVEFALPHGECAHVLPEQSCIYCQPHADQTAEVANFTNSSAALVGIAPIVWLKDVELI